VPQVKIYQQGSPIVLRGSDVVTESLGLYRSKQHIYSFTYQGTAVPVSMMRLRQWVFRR
jgi:hypothetical protein